MTRIAILDLTTHPADRLHGVQRVWERISGWLSPSLPDAALIPFDIADGGGGLPATGDFDGLIVSGSEYGVYDQTEWMLPLRRLLLDTRDAGKPQFGICFGHQIMADCFGGRAEKAAIGRIVGAREFTAAGQRFSAHVWHQDQVTAVPPCAQVTAYADYCPVGALDYEFAARSVQYHPEYDAAHLQDLFARGRDYFIDGPSADAAAAEIAKATVSVDLDAGDVAAFFRKAIRHQS